MKRVSVITLPVLAFASLLFVAASACQGEADRLAVRQAAIEQEVARKLEVFRKIKEQNCRDEVLTAASLIADSLIIANARMQLDTTFKPPKPFKPEQPTLQTLIDSVPVKPLFKEKPKKDSTSKH
ncbi:MAG: hypothetical protein SH848_21340 [Saprospiraceae bacterium]|nr:hypothetical protein [Saprospiraceae bacterium]MDZ4706488.1 hypothetical protein [Saprospiraceae bacterium]